MICRYSGAIIICLFVSLFFQVSGIQAETKQSTSNSTEALIDHLIDDGTITREEADAFKEQYVNQKEKISENVPDTMGGDVELPENQIEDDITPIEKSLHTIEESPDPYTDDIVRNEKNRDQRLDKLEGKVDEILSNEIFNTEWMKRLSIGGDIRLRYRIDYFDKENADLLDPADPTQLLNTKIDRTRGQYRARLDIKAKVIGDRERNANGVEAGLRISTGNEGNPVSTNDTLGDYYNKDNFLIDRAYLKWTYGKEKPFWGMTPGISLTGGRIPNPWFTATNLVWDYDLNFEGAALNLTTDAREANVFSTFLTLGVFSIQEVEFSNRDKKLYGAQVGFKFRWENAFTGTIGAAYFDYDNIEGIVNDPERPGEMDFSAPIYQQMGNTLIDIDPSSDILTALAVDYNLANLSVQADFHGFSPVHLIFLSEFVYNVGFDKEKVAERTGIEDIAEDIFGYQFGMKIGYPTVRKYGQWNMGLYYRHLEADAVLDAFTDSDFHNGGTNAEGFIFAFEMGLYKDLWLSWKWLSADEIAGPQTAIDVLQIDLNFRF